jgi:hypothetical protein
MQIPCPKCNHPSVDIYKDASTSAGSWPANARAHCRVCGHRIYGVAAIRYTEAQAPLIEKEAQEKRAHLIELASQAAVEDARKARKRESDRLYQRRRRSGVTLPKPYIVKPCALPICPHNNRPKSKYCSDSCRKKNNRKKRRKQQA